MELFPLEGFDIWRLLAGLGIFLFGMFLLEEGIQILSGRAFQRLLQQFTNHRIKAVLTGTVATAVLQSSSAVSLMVLAFAGAGVLAMSNAIGVILGSNLGTTFTAWIVATVGFKVNIEAFAMPFIGLGGLGLIFFGKKPRYAAISRLLTGFGFLFMGLEYMKVAVSGYMDSVGTEQFAGLHPLLFIVFGFVFTAITQSSSASLAIILAAVNAGMAGLTAASIFVIGANIGTTMTVMLGALGGSSIKKRVALSHVLFNWITGVLALLSLPFLLYLISRMINVAADPVTALAIFHTLFNLMGVLIFLPFTGLLGRWVVRIYPDKPGRETLFISKTPPTVSTAAAEALRKEAWTLLFGVLRYHNHVLELKTLPYSPVAGVQDFSPPEAHTPEGLYEALKNVSKAMHAYAETLQEQSLSEAQSELINRSLFAARMALFSAKWMKDLGQDLYHWERTEIEAGTLRKVLAARQERVYSQLTTFLQANKPATETYPALKTILSHEEKSWQHQLTADQTHQPHRNAVALAEQLTINKTWYLAWRNLLLALRELELISFENEDEI
ncbi:MAG TPA: Na/Pi symporter [Saprospiraceae bacterium]|nr:Na/Pi symporter [Saprospiraceae bacterium]HMP26124.1 Na/Pi symporter [Saprospiraceae bacterium]